MFNRCTKLSADITNLFDNFIYSLNDNTQLIDKVDIGNMFSGCINIVGTANKTLLNTMKDIQTNVFAGCTKLTNWQFIPERFGGNFDRDIYPEDTVLRIQGDHFYLINNKEEQITIDWGDGLISSYTSGNIEYAYNVQYPQRIIIIKNAKSIQFGQNSIITQVIQLGSTLETYQNMFANCVRLTGLFVPYIQFKHGLNMDNMFAGCSELSVDVSTLFDKDFYASSMNNAFANCIGLTGQLYPLWQSTQYYSHQNAFSGCINISNYQMMPFSYTGRELNTYSPNLNITFTAHDTSFIVSGGKIELVNICAQDKAWPSADIDIHKNITTYIPLTGTIDWGDGITSSYTSGNISHEYQNQHLYYPVTISKAKQFNIKNTEAIVGILHINNYSQTLSGTFKNAINLIDVCSGLFDYPWCTDANEMFKNCYSLTNVPTIDIKSELTLLEMNETFNNCQNLRSIIIENNLPNSVESINKIFKNTKINTLGSTFSLNNKFVESSEAFNNCINLTSIYNSDDLAITKFNTDTSYMFKNCFALDEDLTDRFNYLTTYEYRPIFINVTQMFKNCHNIYGVIPAEMLWNNSLNMFIPFDCFAECQNINNLNNIPVIWGGTAEFYLNKAFTVFELTIPEPDGTQNRMVQEFYNVFPVSGANSIFINWNWNFNSDTANVNELTIDKGWTEYPYEQSVLSTIYVDNGIPNFIDDNKDRFAPTSTYLLPLPEYGMHIIPNNTNWLKDLTESSNILADKKKAKFLTRVLYDNGRTISHEYTAAGTYTILIYNAAAFNTNIGTTKVTNVYQLSNQLKTYGGILRGSGITDLSKSSITLPSTIVDFNNMFKDAMYLTKLPKHFKIHSHIHTIQKMFENCINLQLNISQFFEKFNIRNGVDTIKKFNFSKLNGYSIVISQWPNVLAAFAKCRKIYGKAPADKLFYSNNDFITPINMFKDCINLDNYNLIPKNWGGPFISNNSLVIKYNGAAGPAGKMIKPLKILSKEALNKGLCKFKQYDIYGNLKNTQEFNNDNINSGVQGKSTVPHYMVFENCLPDLDTLDKSKITELIQFPKHCQTITGYFEDCTNLSSISEAVVLAGYSYPRMFTDCTSLKTIPQSFVLSPYITDANGMFAGCSNLTTVNMKKLFENINIIDISNIFDGCNSLTGVVPIQLLSSKLTVSKTSAFLNCSGLLNYNELPSGWI